MLIGVSATFSRWTIQWYPSELQEYRGLYMLSLSIYNNEDILYTPCYQVDNPHHAQQIFTCSQKTLLLRAFEDDQGSSVLFGEEAKVRQYLDARLAEISPMELMTLKNRHQ